MARLFITDRELNLISDITKEVIKDIVGQKIYYYPLSEIKTRTHELYNESPEKIYDNPIEINALVEIPNADTRTTLFGPERLAKLNVFIHFRDMVDRGINITIGDFIRYGERVYEISKYSQMKTIYGHVESIDGIRLECTQARQGQFDPPVIGPTSETLSDKDAVQHEFIQQRGQEQVEDVPTGDVRALQKNGVLEAPIGGPAKVNNKENDPAGPGFYDET